MADMAFFLRSLGGFEKRKKYLAVLLWGRRRARKRTGGSKLWTEALTRGKDAETKTRRWSGRVNKHGLTELNQQAQTQKAVVCFSQEPP